MVDDESISAALIRIRFPNSSNEVSKVQIAMPLTDARSADKAVCMGQTLDNCNIVRAKCLGADVDVSKVIFSL